MSKRSPEIRRFGQQIPQGVWIVVNHKIKNFLGEPVALDDLGWTTNHGLCNGDKVRIKQ